MDKIKSFMASIFEVKNGLIIVDTENDYIIFGHKKACRITFIQTFSVKFCVEVTL